MAWADALMSAVYALLFESTALHVPSVALFSAAKTRIVLPAGTATPDVMASVLVLLFELLFPIATGVPAVDVAARYGPANGPPL